MTNKAFVFGSSGQLGVELCAELQRRGYEVRGVPRAALNIQDLAKVEHALVEFDAQIAFNAAAYNQVDVAEREPLAAFEANALGVRNLALVCRQNDTKLIHFSTDYVFDGQLGRPYRETDAVHPLGAYAVSKLAGELYARAYLEKPLIVRTSGVFGPRGVKTARGNFPELMLRLAREGKPIRVVQDHVASPTYAPALAEPFHRPLWSAAATASSTSAEGSRSHGLSMRSSSSRRPPLPQNLTPTNEREYRTEARRPKFSALENARLRECGVDAMPPLEEAVAQYLEARRRYL